MLSFLNAIPQKTKFKTLAISLYQNDIFIQGNYIKFYSCFPNKVHIYQGFIQAVLLMPVFKKRFSFQIALQ